MAKLIKCPMCHGELNHYNDPNWDCGLCDDHGVVSQKRRMEYVRSFKKKEAEK